MFPETETLSFYNCNDGSTTKGPHGHRGDARLRPRKIGQRKQIEFSASTAATTARCLNFKAALLHCLLLLSLHPCCVSASQFAAGDQVVNTSEVTLDLVQNGKKLGSTKIPPGRTLSVLESGRDARIKVEAPPMLAGWVDETVLKLLTAATPKTDEPTPATASDSSSPTGGATSARPIRQPPLAKTSRVVVEEKTTTEKIVAEAPSKCRGTEHHFSYQPKVTRGEDLRGDKTVLRFYIVELRENKEKTKSSGATRRITVQGHSFETSKPVYEPVVRQLKDSPFRGDDTDLPPVKREYMEWSCRCCRDLRNGEPLGWYAEVLDGEPVVCTAQSSMDQKALVALQEHLARAEQ